MAKTLMNFSRKHALVVHGMDGMDEITICDETLIHEVKDDKIIEYKITPEQFGFNRAFHKDVEGGTGEENGKILEATLKGEMAVLGSDIVVLNAMFGMYCAGKVKTPMDVKEIILKAIKDGKVWEFYQNYKMQKIKICGIKSVDEARVVLSFDISYVYVIFAKSKRKVGLDLAMEIFKF